MRLINRRGFRKSRTILASLAVFLSVSIPARAEVLIYRHSRGEAPRPGTKPLLVIKDSAEIRSFIAAANEAPIPMGKPILMNDRDKETWFVVCDPRGRPVVCFIHDDFIFARDGIHYVLFPALCLSGSFPGELKSLKRRGSALLIPATMIRP